MKQEATTTTSITDTCDAALHERRQQIEAAENLLRDASRSTLDILVRLQDACGLSNIRAAGGWRRDMYGVSATIYYRQRGKWLPRKITLRVSYLLGEMYVDAEFGGTRLPFEQTSVTLPAYETTLAAELVRNYVR
jgi:hypothetical protein